MVMLSVGGIDRAAIRATQVLGTDCFVLSDGATVGQQPWCESGGFKQLAPRTEYERICGCFELTKMRFVMLFSCAACSCVYCTIAQY